MTWLVRPYPFEEVSRARAALTAATEGDLQPLQDLYQRARDALLEADPDEVEDLMRAFGGAPKSDRAAARAAAKVAEEWEGIVTVGASIRDPFRFRGFSWAAASKRYDLGGTFEEFSEGLDFPGVSPEDAALYVVLPALIGLGAEFPEEIAGPVPLEGERVAELLGLEHMDVAGVDPLDAIVVRAETVRAAFASLDGAWREVASRCTETGMLVREDP